MTTLAIIPARGGSKRIPRKNVKEFCGKPMIAWSILAAQKSMLFDQIIVSTDDEEIASVAQSYGAEVPFRRPVELADDYTPTMPVIAHAIRWWEEHRWKIDVACCLYATAPFVRAGDLQRGYSLLRDNKEVDFTFSVTSYAFPIFRALRCEPSGRVSMFWPENALTRSQDLPEAFHDAGQFYWGSTNAWLSKTAIFNSQSLPVFVPRLRVQDIDTLEDWENAERLFLGDEGNAPRNVAKHIGSKNPEIFDARKLDARLKRHELGFLEVIDRPTSVELSEYYAKRYFQNEKGNYRSQYSDEERSIIELRIEQRAAQAISLLGKEHQNRSLLDVGCGEGFVLKHFARLGWQVQGIDFGRTGVQQINPEYIDYVEQGDIFEILDARLKADERFDLVWLGNVLEHVLDPVGLLRSLRRLLVPDGLLVVTVPNDGTDYHEELYRDGHIANRFWIAVPDHLSYFSALSLRRTVEATGWECLALHGDFPIDMFLAHDGSNYVNDRSQGPGAHQARLLFERLIGKAGVEAANRFLAALAEVGFGRNLTAFLRMQAENLAHDK